MPFNLYTIIYFIELDIEKHMLLISELSLCLFLFNVQNNDLELTILLNTEPLLVGTTWFNCSYAFHWQGKGHMPLLIHLTPYVRWNAPSGWPFFSLSQFVTEIVTEFRHKNKMWRKSVTLFRHKLWQIGNNPSQIVTESDGFRHNFVTDITHSVTKNLLGPIPPPEIVTDFPSQFPSQIFLWRKKSVTKNCDGLLSVTISVTNCDGPVTN